MKTITVKNATSRKVSNGLNKLISTTGVCKFVEYFQDNKKVTEGRDYNDNIIAKLIVCN